MEKADFYSPVNKFAPTEKKPPQKLYQDCINNRLYLSEYF